MLLMCKYWVGKGFQIFCAANNEKQNKIKQKDSKNYLTTSVLNYVLPSLAGKSETYSIWLHRYFLMQMNYFYLRQNVPINTFIFSLIEKPFIHYSFICVAEEVTKWCRLNYLCTLNPNGIYPPIEKGKMWHEVVFQCAYIRTKDNNWTVPATTVSAGVGIHQPFLISATREMLEVKWDPRNQTPRKNVQRNMEERWRTDTSL